MPRVSIGMPVYNGAGFLTTAIESILAQDFEDFELVISDNASTDDTQGICERYARADKRVKYSRLPENQGAAPNYNRVFNTTSGEYFKWAAHDDVIKPSFLSRCLDVHERSTGTPVAIVYPQTDYIDAGGKVIRQDIDHMVVDSAFAPIRVFQVLQSMNMVPAICGLMRRDILARTKLIGSFVGSDYVLLVQIALLGRIAQLDGESLFQRRIHKKMSRKANLTRDEVLKWFDPKARSRLTIKQRLYLEYLRSAFDAHHLSFGNRSACAVSIVSSVALRQSRVMLGRWRRALVSG